jgi:hypothetical protein
MDSAEHCKDQSAECRRLMGIAKSAAEAEVLNNIAQSWSRLAGQVERYNALIREPLRVEVPPLGAALIYLNRRSARKRPP